jgi:hypothetical protein
MGPVPGKARTATTLFMLCAVPSAGMAVRSAAAASRAINIYLRMVASDAINIPAH